MNESVLDHLARAVDEGASSDGNIHIPPIAVLWPDKDRQWDAVVELLRTRRRVLTLSPYSPVAGSGPALWIRCVVEGTLSIDGPRGLPTVYIPGVTREDLRNVDATNQTLAPLAPLQHNSRGTYLAETPPKLSDGQIVMFKPALAPIDQSSLGPWQLLGASRQWRDNRYLRELTRGDT